MALSSNFMKAILSLDSYNRGYEPRVVFNQGGDENASNTGTKLGAAVIFDSYAVEAQSFYGIAYLYNGEAVISYRGTDALINKNFFTGDVWNGYAGGAGSPGTNQAVSAYQFYQTVADELATEGVDPHSIGLSISLTGHF